MGIQLGILLEIRSLPWSVTNHNNAQKMVQNLELAQETMKVPQPPKKRSKLFQVGKKLILVDSAEFPKMIKNLNDATSFLEFPNDFPESILTNMNKMRNVQEAGFKDFKNQMKQAEVASCHLVNIKVAIESLLLK